MRTNIYKYGICMLSLLSLVACKNENELAYSTTPLSTKLYQGQSTDVAVKSFGVKSSQGYDVDGVKWSSADEFIATVDANGKATAQHVGNVRIYGEFDGGKTVYCDLNVAGRYNFYNEPLAGIDSMGQAKAYEAGMQKAIVRGGGADDDYVVFKDTAAEYSPYVDYTIYLNGAVKGQMVSFKTEDVYNSVEKNFLPERYWTPQGYFNNPYDVRVVLNTANMSNVAYYMSDKAPVGIDKLVAAYKASALKDLNKSADASSYSKKALELANEFNYSSVDKDALANLVAAGTSTINNATKVADVENELVAKASEFEALYVVAGRNSAAELCYGELKKGHEQSEYYEASWNKISELDAGLTQALADAKTIKELDKATSDYSVQYSDILVKIAADGLSNALDASYNGYQAKSSEYDPAVWAMLEADYNKASTDPKDGIKAQYSEKKANEIQRTTVASFADYMTIEGAKTEKAKSKEDFEEQFESTYKSSDYSAENWQTMLDIKAKALADMDKAVKKSELTDIAAQANKDLKAVKKVEK